MNHLRSVPPGAVVARPRADRKAQRRTWCARLAQRSGLAGHPSPLGGQVSAPIGGACPRGLSVKAGRVAGEHAFVCDEGHTRHT
jgi:hypothetical protein